jgi:predicted site-specific integrase-resolvase
MRHGVKKSQHDAPKNMTKFNITQSAKAVGVSRKTIQRHLKEGKVSFEVDAQGKKWIDPSELIRVYGEIKAPDTPDIARQDEPKLQHDAGSDAQVTEVLQQRIEDLEGQVEDLRQDKEASRKREEDLLTIIKQQQTLLLPPPQQPKKAGLWARVFGG